MNELERERIASRLAEIDEELCRPEVLRNPSLIRTLTAERADLARIREVLNQLEGVEADITEMRTALEDGDAELVQIARDELPSLEGRHAELEEKLRRLLIPPDPALSGQDIRPVDGQN